MMAHDDPLCLYQFLRFLSAHMGRYCRIYSYVCENNIIRTCKVQQTLLPFICRFRVYRPVEFLPAVIPIPKLYIFPLLMPIVISPPISPRQLLYILLRLFIYLPRTDKSYPQFVKCLQIMFIEKPTVHPHDDRYMRIIMFPYEIHKIGNHVHHRGAIIAVLANMAPRW